MSLLTKRPSYDLACKDIILKISAIIAGKCSDDSKLPADTVISIFKQLIAGAKEVPYQARKRWDAFRYQQHLITIDMRSLYWAYKAFMPLLFDPKCQNLLLLDKIVQLFPNVTGIICKNADNITGGRWRKEDYWAVIVCSNFMLGIKDRLSKMDKQAKLTKIVIQTYEHEIKDDCKLYTARFLTLGWQIQKGSYDSWGNAKKNNQITLTGLQAPKASFPNGALASTDTNENKPNDHQPADEVFDID